VGVYGWAKKNFFSGGGGVRGALPPESDIKTFIIFFAVDGVFQVIDINIGIENDEGDEIGQEDIPQGCPKGYFEGEDIRQLHIYLLVENIYGN
jgi:hypothetical protein